LVVAYFLGHPVQHQFCSGGETSGPLQRALGAWTQAPISPRLASVPSDSIFCETTTDLMREFLLVRQKRKLSWIEN